MTYKLAVVATHPIQHFCPLYKQLAAEAGIETRVIFGSRAGSETYFDPGFGTKVRWKDDLLNGFAHEFTSDAHESSIGRTIEGRGIGRLLSRFDPDATLIYGFSSGIARRAFAWAWSRQRRILYVSDSELKSEVSTVTRLRKWLTLPILFRQIDSFLSIGDCNEEYYRRYGVERARIFRSPLTIDETSLVKPLGRREAERRSICEALRVRQDAVVGLVVGKLIPRKRPLDAIEAVGRIAGRLEPGRLVLIVAGDGELREGLQSRANELSPGAFRFLGFISAERLVSYYAACDFLVHPASADPHPLATSEAVFCGLPIVASDQIGSIGPTDDVRPGVNALIYPCGDMDRLAEQIERLTRDVALRAKLSEGSRRAALDRTLGKSVDGILRAIGHEARN
jgi:glycosyltransferase involved in cell wall biosynthesis